MITSTRVGAGVIAGVVAVGLVAIVTPASADAVAKTFAKPAFSATADELLAAARAAPAGDWPVVVLDETEDLAFAADSTVVRTWRRVFVVRSAAGVNDWGELGGSWKPYYQERPVIRARVIAPDGGVAELDPTLVTDAPTVSDSPTVFSDDRDIAAPLPRLVVGAVVEEQIVTTDKAPLLPAGVVESLVVGLDGVPTLRARIVVSAPKDARLRRVESNLPRGVAAHHAVRAGRDVWTYAFGRIEPTGELEAYVDADTRQRIRIDVATGESWGAVAAGYAALVDAALAKGPPPYPAGIAKTATRATVDALVAWLHAHVRYTGIELADSAIVPWPPDEVVRRGFGDCKDKAALLVALLRAAGISADLALLSTGPGLDVAIGLPGMGDFDHAIVHARLDGKDLWIDATEDLVPVGSLPLRDQGRRALVATATTTALVTTPMPASTDNVIREVRRYDLATSGAATITEISREGGSFEADGRGWIRDTPTREVSEGLANYGKREYHAAVVRYTTTAPGDLASPFEVTTVFGGTTTAVTGRRNIEVWIAPRSALVRVPDIFKARTPDAPARVHDVVWSQPHIYEIEYRLILPPGYAAPALPADRTVALGPATFTETNRIDGGAVVVTYRFDSGKAQISPAQLATMQDAMGRLSGEDRHIVIDGAAFALHAAGKAKEAVTALTKLATAHPKEAVYQQQLADLWLQIGLGDAARRAARKAVALAPKSADALTVLGWVLEHDRYGRPLAVGMDRKGALAALAKARALAPSHAGAAVELARVLERGSDGSFAGPDADLAKAAATWREVLAHDDTDEHATAAMLDLLLAGDAAGCEALARSRAATVDRDALLVAAVATSRGADPAVAELATRTVADRRAALATAIRHLIWARRYDDARALYARRDAGAPAQPYDAVIADLAPYDQPRYPADDPRGAVERVMRRIASARETAPMWDAEVERELEPLRTAARTPAILALIASAPTRTLTDSLSSNLVFITTTGSGPWRIELSAGGARSIWYVATRAKAAAVLGGPGSTRGVGRFALARLAAKDGDTARQLLDWVAADAPSKITSWGSGVARDDETAALAAATLAGTTAGARGIAPFTDCAGAPVTARRACDFGLAAVLIKTGRYEAAATHTATWLARAPGDGLAVALRAEALARLGEFDDALKLVDGALATATNGEVLLEEALQIAVLRAAPDEVSRRADAFAAMPGATATNLNRAAWGKAVSGDDPAGAAEIARRAKTLAPSSAAQVPAGLAAIQNTLGIALLLAGDLGPGRDQAWAAIASRGSDAPVDLADDLALGILAESLGLPGDAAAAYQRAAADPGTDPDGVAVVAKRRLAALKRH